MTFSYDFLFDWADFLWGLLEVRSVEPVCKIYTTWEVFKYNMIWWNSAFILGCNFTHADCGPMQHFTLEWSVMKTWGKWLWLMFIVLILLLLKLVLNLATKYYELGILQAYILWATLLYAFMVWNTKKQKQNGKQLHVHHYFLALIVMSFISL